MADLLLERGHKLVVIDNLVTGSIDNIAHLKGRPGFDGMIAEACSKVYEDEFEHMLIGIAGVAEEGLAEADWKLLGTLIVEQLKQRIRMRNAQFSYPLSEERVQAIYRGDIRPLEFDYERAQLAA